MKTKALHDGYVEIKRGQIHFASTRNRRQIPLEIYFQTYDLRLFNYIPTLWKVQWKIYSIDHSN